MSLLKNGGWRGCGEFVSIRKEFDCAGKKVQICSYTKQRDANGTRRSREYFEARTADNVVDLGPGVRSLRAAAEAAEQIVRTDLP